MQGTVSETLLEEKNCRGTARDRDDEAQRRFVKAMNRATKIGNGIALIDRAANWHRWGEHWNCRDAIWRSRGRI